MANRKVRCETQNNDDASSDALVVIQVLMQLKNAESSTSSSSSINNNVVRRGREKRIQKNLVDQILKNNKNSETDEPEKIKYRSLADIYAVTKPINPKN
jgi:predicted transcriptional regulator